MAASGIFDLEGSLLSLRVLLFADSVLLSRCFTTEDKMLDSGPRCVEAKDGEGSAGY